MNKSKISSKYNKISQQQKYHLLTLVLKQKMLIRQAATVVGINYSTAKTIIFFNRNQSKSYQFDIQTHQNNEKNQIKQRVNVKQLSQNIQNQNNYEKIHNFIEILCTIGNKFIQKQINLINKKIIKNHDFQNDIQQINISNSQKYQKDIDIMNQNDSQSIKIIKYTRSSAQKYKKLMQKYKKRSKSNQIINQQIYV